MKAEVTEVPASQLILDGGHNATGKKIAHKEPLIKENSSQGMYYIGALGYDIIVLWRFVVTSHKKKSCFVTKSNSIEMSTSSTPHAN